MPISTKLKPLAARYMQYACENSFFVTREGYASFESSLNRDLTSLIFTHKSQVSDTME